MVIFKALLGHHDTLILGKSPFKWRQLPKVTIAVNCDIKHQFKQMSRLMVKPTICIGENKDADQLCGNREADQRLCFRYSDSTIPPLLNSKISSF